MSFSQVKLTYKKHDKIDSLSLIITGQQAVIKHKENKELILFKNIDKACNQAYISYKGKLKEGSTSKADLKMLSIYKKQYLKLEALRKEAVRLCN